MADFYSSNGIPTIFPYDTDFDLVPYTQNLQKHVYIDPCYKHLNEVFGESSSKHFVDTSTYVKNPLFNAFENLTDINISIPGAKEHKRQEQGTQEASSSSEDYCHAVMPPVGVSDVPLYTSLFSDTTYWKALLQTMVPMPTTIQKLIPRICTAPLTELVILLMITILTKIVFKSTNQFNPLYRCRT